MLDKRDLSPVGYKRYSKKTGKEVEWNNIIKGYEYDKDRYVVLSDEDFRRANVESNADHRNQGLCVSADEIPAEYFETPYYLVPAERGAKVYALLRETLKSTGRVAVGEVVIRTTQHLAMVAPVGRSLMLVTMRYADQLRGTRGLELPAESLKSAGVTGKEVALAKRLVDDMTLHWKPQEYKDTYHQDLMRRIREKIKRGETKEITKPEDEDVEQPHSAQVIDLTALLKRSLARSMPRARTAPPRPKPPARKAPMHAGASPRGSMKSATKRKQA